MFKTSEKAREGNRRRNQRWRERNPDHVRALDRRKSLKHYYANHEANKARLRIRAKTRHASTHPDRRRSYRLRLAYGITLEERDAMVAKQGGCAGCGCVTPPGKRGWQVDHCHKTNRVRGVLCTNCNTGLGLAKDNPDILKRWIKYLRKHQRTHHTIKP